MSTPLRSFIEIAPDSHFPLENLPFGIFKPNEGAARAGVVPLRMKGNTVADARCSCGFTEAGSVDVTISDHLLEMFAPEDDKGTDGRYHLEGEPGLTCVCGFAAATAAELDAHFLQAFTRTDHIGHDGHEHDAARGG